MIGIINKDSSFFTVESADVILNETDFQRNLMSLSITEKMDTIPQGTLKFYDPDHIYSRILRTGVQLNITWGYKKFGVSLDSILPKQINPTEVSGTLIRRGLNGFVSSPSGGGSNNGVVIYNCNFTSYEFRGLDKARYFTEGIKADVIATLFDEFGISTTNRIIDFSRGNERLSTELSVRQDETSFRFLSRLAREWRAMFQFTYASDGKMIGIFIDPDKVDKISISGMALKTTGLSHVIGYKGEVSNVKSYSWTSNESESGVGQNVRMIIVDGKPVFQRFIAETETVVTYRLRPDKIQKAFQDRQLDGIEAQTKLARELLSANDFEQIERFFDPITSTTAPQGFGYRLKCAMMGNPLYVPPNLIIVNNGFPDRIGNKQTKFYLEEVTHTIDKSGYNMDVSIVDVFSLSDIGEALL